MIDCSSGPSRSGKTKREGWIDLLVWERGGGGVRGRKGFTKIIIASTNFVALYLDQSVGKSCDERERERERERRERERGGGGGAERPL